jgi:hypothetical protein
VISASSESKLARERVAAGRVAIATLLCLLGFIGFSASAMALYPGGTWSDRSAPGHSFFANFFCDLSQPIALSGVPNPLGSLLAQLGMLLLAGALSGLFWIVPRHFSGAGPASLWVRSAGSASVLTFIFVALAPSERYGNLHAALALTSGGFGILAAFIAIRGLLARAGAARALGLLGVSALAAGALAALLFVLHFRDSTPAPLSVPAAQKLAALLLVAWIAAVSVQTLVAGRGKPERDSG